MLSFNEEDDTFFDSVERLSSEGSCADRAELVQSLIQLDYEVWMNEPRSVRERKESFLRQLGLAEDTPESSICSARSSEDCGAASSSRSLPVNSAVESSDCVGKEMYSESIRYISKLGRKESDANSFDVTESSSGSLPSYKNSTASDSEAHVNNSNNLVMDKKKMRNWWKRFSKKQKSKMDVCSCKSSVSVIGPDPSQLNRMKVRQNQKKCMEFSAIYVGQEIKAHKGSIWKMKFSPDGQYLASGGEDGVVRIWRVKFLDASRKIFTPESDIEILMKECKSSVGKKNPSQGSIVIPNRIFRIEESPLHELHGHSGDVLDLAWSNSNSLLSSSKDKTVRLWQIGSSRCFNVFQHNDYVTSVQFNPIDENYFISGSIDGKVRIWGVPEGRVVDWTNARDVVTAICYQPNGKGFIVGSISGTCRFYGTSGNHLQLEAQLRLDGKKRTSHNKITGIEFSKEDGRRIMITSGDSKVRILDGCNMVQKYRGLRNSGSQMSASFASTGRHIVSVGEDSRVYIWNYNSFSAQSKKDTKSIRSCEHFFSEGVSTAVPWSGMTKEHRPICTGLSCSFQRGDPLNSDYLSKDSDRFSLSSWFTLDVPYSKGCATWPEEQLTPSDLPTERHHQHLRKCSTSSDAWGLVIVTASFDGKIRSYHNYGLPVRP